MGAETAKGGASPHLDTCNARGSVADIQPHFGDPHHVAAGNVVDPAVQHVAGQ